MKRPSGRFTSVFYPEQYRVSEVVSSDYTTEEFQSLSSKDVISRGFFYVHTLQESSISFWTISAGY